MNIHLFKNVRLWHKWIGLVCSVFFLILSVSGVLLMHYDGLGLGDKEVSGKFLPAKYFEVTSQRKSVQSLALSPSGVRLFVGTHHGLYRSEDAGKTWEELKQGLFNQDIRSLAILPGMESVVYAATAAGVFKSEDGGDSWSDWFDEASGLANGDVRDLVLHPKNPDRLFAATAGGLFTSDDAGESWSPSFSGGETKESADVHLVRFSAVDSETLYIGTAKGAYRSRDNGNTWQQVWKNTIPQINALVSVQTEPEFLYIGTDKGLFKSFNKGRTWVTDRNKNLKRIDSMHVDPTNTSRILVASRSRLYTSQNGGDTWKELGGDLKQVDTDGSKSIRVTGIAGLAKENPVLLAATTAGLFISRDAGSHWQVQDLANGGNPVPQENMTMDLVKLITEIHTGRFFGSYFVLLVDVATVGLLLLIVSGSLVTLYRYQVKKRRAISSAEELETDLIIDIQETADDLSIESLEIHDMIEHISNHLDKCKTVYMSREKKEIEEMGRHITTLDKKMHHLMHRIGEFEKFTKN